MNDYRDPTTGHVQSEPACSCEGDCDCLGLEAETAKLTRWHDFVDDLDAHVRLLEHREMIAARDAGCPYCVLEPIGATVSMEGMPLPVCDDIGRAIARLESASKAHNPDAVLSVLRRMP